MMIISFIAISLAAAVLHGEARVSLHSKLGKNNAHVTINFCRNFPFILHVIAHTMHSKENMEY